MNMHRNLLLPCVCGVAFVLMLGMLGARAEDNTTNIINAITNDLSNGTLTVGQNGSNNVLIVSQGGSVFDGTGVIGNGSNANNNLVWIKDSGSVWSNSGEMDMAAGTSPYLTGLGTSTITTNISILGTLGGTNGIVVTNFFTGLGNGIVNGTGGSSGNSLLITDGGRLMSSGSKLGAGGAGGAGVIDSGGVIGMGPIGGVGGEGGTSNQVVITGAQSLWFDNGDLFIGGGGDASSANAGGSGGTWNSVMLSNGGVMINSNSFIGVGGSGGSTGVADVVGGSNNSVRVVGSGSCWSNAVGICIGSGGMAGTGGASNALSVLSGGFTIAAYLKLGSGNDATNSNGFPLPLMQPSASNGGNGGAANYLNIAGGGSLVTDSANIGGGGSSGSNNIAGGTGGAGNMAWITGAGSVWSNATGLRLGTGGAGGRGPAGAAPGCVGGNGGDSNQFAIAGGGQLGSAGGDIGGGGHGGTNGGATTNWAGGVGSSGNKLWVTDSGSSWINSTNFNLGCGGLAGGAYVETRHTNSDGLVAVEVNIFNGGDGGTGGNGNLLIISNSGAMHSCGGNIGATPDSPGAIGYYYNFSGYLMNNTGTSGAGGNSNQVSVMGSGSVWGMTADLNIGARLGGMGGTPCGSDNSLLVTDGGTVAVNGNVHIGTADSGSNSLVSVQSAGHLLVTNVNSSGTLAIENGSLQLDGGTASADKLCVTNGSGHVVWSNGGLLDIGSALVSNGVPFVVGDGSSPATLNLRGTNNVFADGLIIPSNAVLSGTGLFIGDVVATGSVASTLTFDGNVVFWGAPTAAVAVVANPPGGGQVFGGRVYPVGARVRLSAVPAPGWGLAHWSDGSTDTSHSVVVPTNGGTYTATFAAAAIITVQVSSNVAGRVACAGGVIIGSNTVLTASASNGWQFVRWSDGLTNNPRSVVVLSNMTYTANFAPTAALSVQAHPINGGWVTGGGTYLIGARVQLSTVASNGWRFTGWNDGVITNPRMITVPTNGASYTANFVQQLATLTAVANPSSGGAITGGGTFPVGTNIQLVASARAGWLFSGWSDGNTNTTRLITIPAANCTYTANFARGIGAAVDATNLNWTTGGNASWAVQTATTHDRVVALKSGALSAGQQSYFQTTTNGPGSLMFWWKSSAASANTLQFYIDTQLVSQISGNVDWNQYVGFIGTSNPVTLKWVYTKNSAAVTGSDAGFVDQVTWMPCDYVTSVAQIFYQDPTGTLASWVLSSGGGMRFARLLGNTGGWALKAVGDIDGDGVGDLLFQSASGETSGWFMNADGSVRSARSLWSMGGWAVKACGDYEGTGQAQVFFQDAVGNVTYWRLDTNGNHLTSANLGNMGGWKLRGLGDLDGDHKAELFWQNAAGQVVIWYHKADGSIRSVPAFSTGGWLLCGVVDIDADGSSDLLWQDGVGNTGGWFMHSNGTARAASYWWNTGGWKLKAAGR